MVKGTIIEEKKLFSDDSARRFMQTIQQMSCNIITPDLSLHSSPSRTYPLCLSGFREVKSFLYLFTHSSPLFTHIEFVIHYTQYGNKKAIGAIRIGGFPYLSPGSVSTESAVSGLPSNQLFPGLSPHPYLLPAYS